MKSKVTKMKVMHVVEKDGNGQPTIRSIVSNPPNLKEATDKIQQAEETGHKTPKTAKPKEAKGNEMTELDHKILQALDALGGRTLQALTLLRRQERQRRTRTLHAHPFDTQWNVLKSLVTSRVKRKGAKYLFTITERGKTALTHPPQPVKDIDKPKDKGAHNPAPASTISTHQEPAAKPSETVKERPANTDVQCQACKTWYVYAAEFCAQCGKPMKAAPIGNL